jgi:hypothetical protein
MKAKYHLAHSQQLRAMRPPEAFQLHIAAGIPDKELFVDAFWYLSNLHMYR